jgi:MFS superfamily sulfate permease-like transporter
MYGVEDFPDQWTARYVGRAVAIGEEEAPLTEAKGRVALVHVGGPLSFCAPNGLGRRLLGGADTRVLVLDLTDVPSIDSSASASRPPYATFRF